MLTGKRPATISGNTASFYGTADADYYWVSAGLTLTSSVAMNFRFHAASTDDLTVTLTLNGVAHDFTEDDFTAVDGMANVYEISYTKISAEQFGEDVYAAMERNEQQLGNELLYSVYAYAQSKQTDANAALQALVKALYNYGADAVDSAGYIG